MALSESQMRALVITCMLIFGTFTVVFQKLVLTMSGEGRDGDTHKFKKPWFQTEVMFVGMMGCLFVYEVINFMKKRNHGDEETTSLIGASDGSVQGQDSSAPSHFKQYIIVMAPASCDMIATASMNIGLLWIPASVWQMLRGSMVIFSALFSKFFLKKQLYAYHWTGVGTVVFALLVVAFSALMTPPLEHSSSSVLSSSISSSSSSSQIAATTEDSSSSSTSSALEAIGIVLVVAAQVIQASQIVIEEHLLKGISINPILIVGLEGLWGSLMCSVVLFIVYFIPLSTMIGEDTIDTFIMLGKNPVILIFNIMYAIFILCYNLFGMLVTQYTTAVIRTIIEALRTACIWIVNLFIHYCITGNMKGFEDFGEVWTDWSYLQLCGFIFLLLGLFIYNGIVRIQGLYYPDAEVKHEDDDN